MSFPVAVFSFEMYIELSPIFSDTCIGKNHRFTGDLELSCHYVGGGNL